MWARFYQSKVELDQPDKVFKYDSIQIPWTNLKTLPIQLVRIKKSIRKKTFLNRILLAFKQCNG